MTRSPRGLSAGRQCSSGRMSSTKKIFCRPRWRACARRWRGWTLSRSLVKGDALSASIGAASIIAKVTRDRYMCALGQQYPQYQLEKHKGYGTRLHYELLAKHGIAPFYRRSFLKKWLAQREAANAADVKSTARPGSVEAAANAGAAPAAVVEKAGLAPQLTAAGTNSDAKAEH